MTRHVGYEWGLGWPSDAPAIFWIRFAILRGMVGFIVAEKLRLSLSDSDDEVKAAATVTVTGLTRMMAAGGAPAAGRGRVIVSSQRPIT